MITLVYMEYIIPGQPFSALWQIAEMRRHNDWAWPTTCIGLSNMSTSWHLEIHGMLSHGFVSLSSYGHIHAGLKPGNVHKNLHCTLVLLQLAFKRYMACARNKLWWMTPEWGTTGSSLPPETQFLLLELEEPGMYAAVLPLIDGDFRGTLRPHRYAGNGWCTYSWVLDSRTGVQKLCACTRCQSFLGVCLVHIR
jgi:hypothetical protein